jgi:hypothetical protein
VKHHIARITQSIKRQNSATKRKALEPIKRGLLTVKRGLALETQETKTMLITYQRFTKGQASKLEMEEANKQFVDVIRGLGLGVLVVLPFAPLTLPFIVKLGERIGINVLPSAFSPDSQGDESITIQVETEILVEHVKVSSSTPEKT